MTPSNRLTFAWWNLHNFAHYDPSKIVLVRFPNNLLVLEFKKSKIVNVFEQLLDSIGLDMVTACQKTPEAALDLQAQLPSDFSILRAPVCPGSDEFQVAVFSRMAKYP